MNAEFYQGKPTAAVWTAFRIISLLLLFSGSSIQKDSDENYPFLCRSEVFSIWTGHWAGTTRS